jgi:putative acetyltransferase
MQLPYRSREKRGEWLSGALADVDTHFLAAEVDGRMVGNLGLHTNGRHPRRKHMAALGMSVHDDYQGRGVGTALMQAAVDMSDNWLNVRRIGLEVYTDNEPAIALYKRFGFEIEGTLRDFSFRQGAYVDAYAMARIHAPN